MDNFDRKKYLYYSKKWKGDFPKESPKFKNNLIGRDWHPNCFHPDHRKVKKLEKEFIDEIALENPDWVKERRLEFLNGESKRINREIIFWIKKANCYKGWFFISINEVCAKPLIKELNEVYKEIDMYKNPRMVETQDISDEDIEMAKSYPFENLIESKKHFALCPFHNDQHPSFYIKNNYGYCFSCGKSVDTIQFLIETENMTFRDAVHYLNNM